MNKDLTKLIIGHVFLHGCMAGMRMAAPLWALHEGYSAAAVGVLLAMFAVTQIFIALPVGRFAEVRGLKHPIKFCVATASVGAALPFIYPSIWTLGLAAMMTGGAIGAAVIVIQRHVGRSVSEPSELKQAFSWLSLGPAFSNFLGPLTTGFLIDHAGFRTAFFVMSAFPLIMWLWMRKTPESDFVPAVSTKPQPAWELLREPILRRIFLVNWLLSACWDVHTFVVPILGHERGYSASTIGMILGAFAFAAAGVRALIPFFGKDWAEWKVVSGASLIACVLYGVYPLLPNAAFMLLCSVTLGFALGAVQPMIMSMLHQVVEDSRQGQALALRMMVINFSSVSLPMVFGAAGAVFGVAPVFWAVALTVGVNAKISTGLKLNKDNN